MPANEARAMRSGERNRCLSSPKARATAHSNQMREWVLSEHWRPAAPQVRDRLPLTYKRKL
jgi:hypothetical protein